MKTSTRVEWIDIVKGSSILMVVLYHIGLTTDIFEYEVDWLLKVNTLLLPIRMPAFFFAAGFVAYSSLQKPWSAVFHKRILFYLYLFVLWSILRFEFFATVMSNPRTPEEGNDWLWLLQSLVLPETGAWFLWALAIFYVIAKLLANVPQRIVLPIAAGISIVGFSGVIPVIFSAANLLQYFVFFYVACHFRPAIISVSGKQRVLFTVGAPVFAVFTVLAWRSSQWWIDGPAEFVAACAGVAALVGTAVLLQNSRVGDALVYFGLHTLSIYVLHLMIVTWATASADHYLWPEGAVSITGLIATLMVMGVGIPLAFESLANRTGLSRVLFRLPKLPSRSASTATG